MLTSDQLAALAAPQEISDLIFGEQYKAYEDAHGLSSSPCAVCGRKCSPKGKSRHVQLDIFITIYEPTAEVEETLEELGRNQGCFPVGSACAKRIPAKYLTALREIDS